MVSLLETRQTGAGGTMLHAPYPPTTSALGGRPTKGLDIPITAVFLVLFILGAVAHMTILQINQRHGHKFLMSGMIFGFCMSRIATMVLRIVWACYVTNVRLAIAANIFVAAGVVLLFVVNLLFAQRILRAHHPHVGWHAAVHFAFIGIYVLIVVSLIALITSVIQSFYTLNKNTKRIDRDIQLYGQTLYAIISFLPIPLVLISTFVPRKSHVEKFGTGRFREKIAILLVASAVLCLGASFRAGVNYAGGTRLANNPAGYQSKACFYIFNFTVEIIVVFLYVVVRVDKRFYVPNHSKGPGDYSRREEDLIKTESRGEGRLERAIEPEEETFDDAYPKDVEKSTQIGRGVDVEKGGDGSGIGGGALRDVEKPEEAHIQSQGPPSVEDGMAGKEGQHDFPYHQR